MSDATCETCPYVMQLKRGGECHHDPPLRLSETDSSGVWPFVLDTDWCGEHPDRQPHLECATATLVTHDDDGPSAADMRRIVDALEQMAHCAARVQL